MKSLIRACACGFLVSLLLPLHSNAENGAIGYARPATGIVVDGDLSDWPDNAIKHPIQTGLFDDGSGWRDPATFLAAYDPLGRYLYLAIDTEDESTVDLPEGGPTDEDTVVVYIDVEHSMRGSGPWMFRGELDRVTNMSEAQSWDPQTARASETHVQLAVGQAEGRRIQEWRVLLDQPVRPGMSIGLDVLLVDIDDQALGNPPAVIGWGKYGSKEDRASRLGDLILLGSDDQMGRLSGDLAWADGVDGPDLGGYRVRIRDLNDPELWLLVETDDQASFSVELPIGHYCITPFLMLTGPAAEFRIRDDVEICADVHAGIETRADTLVQTLSAVPDHHIQESGILFDFDADAAQRLDAFMADYMHHYTIPGASVAIIKDGEIVYRQDYGVTNWLTQAPVNAESLFDMGSITKAVFAFAVHRLIDHGVLELDRPLHEYMPFEDIAHDERSKLFTARHVLSHQTGLPNWRWQNEDRKLDIAFTPGQGYRYSGEGYDYLGRVIEHLTGEDLETVLMREAVEPLGMSSAVRFSKRGDWHDRFVIGHSERRAFISPTPDKAHAAYSMMASAEDVAQMLQTWVQRGGGLSEHGYETMFEAQVETGDVAGGTNWIAYHGAGPRIFETPFGRTLGHGGLNWGQISLIELYEDHDAGFVITTNGDDGMHVRDALRRFLVAGKAHSVGPETED
jgi:CubicO group peptidase (beta-lactamase class C family)